MNGVSDHSEFVEVDPTGRYGRVTLCLSLSFSLPTSVFLGFSELLFQLPFPDAFTIPWFYDSCAVR